MYKLFYLLLVVILGSNLSSFAQTSTYNYTGSVQVYTVGAGVTGIAVNVRGAMGGVNSDTATYADRGGYGGCVIATLTVTPGQILNLYVGGCGENGNDTAGGFGGWNGGGNGEHSYGNLSGGGGGGASDIRIGGVALANRVIVAAGGGGAGIGCGLQKERGGDGGAATGEDGAALCGTQTAAQGGNATGPVAGGTCLACSGLAGFPGALGQGGNAGPCCDITFGTASAGGGGGGGFWGGGGGQWDGGGGGSNFEDLTYASGITDLRGCNTTGCGKITITVTCIAGSIIGPDSVCAGSTVSMTNSITGGTWSTINTTVASITSGGVVTGGAITTADTTSVVYTISAGCRAVKVITVNPLPAAIGGPTFVCVDDSITLTDATAGGTWSSNPTTVATFTDPTSGVLTGRGSGVDTVTYTSIYGCTITKLVTVNASPFHYTVTGGGTMCAGDPGFPIGLSGSDIGVNYRLWRGVTPVGAVMPGTGSALSFGTFTTAGTYVVVATLTTGTGCSDTMSGSATIVVNPLPGAIGGSVVICVGSITPLVNDSLGGTWSSSNTAKATIDSLTGIITGVDSGTTIITYKLPTGCYVTRVETINLTPAPIAGPTVVCEGATITLTDATIGAVWISGNTSIATITSGGILGGGSGGVDSVFYTFGTGCSVFTLVTVNPAPGPISGPTAVCVGDSITLTDGTSGAAWSSTNTAVATIDSVSGVLTGTGGGTVTISYTFTSTTGCASVYTVVVNPTPDPIVGPTVICQGQTATYIDGVPGATWSVSDPSVATVDAGGNVTGLLPGTDTLFYGFPTGCGVFLVFTVNPAPSPISGPTSVCQGDSITLIDTSPGGAWSSTATTIATIDSISGVLTGTGSGIATISYTYTSTTGCAAVYSVTVNLTPTPIVGPTDLCQGATTTYTDGVPGAAWSSSDITIATIDPVLGTAGGVLPGADTIFYGFPSGCGVFLLVTVDPAPTPITSTDSVVCVGSTITLTDGTGGASWSSTNTSIATIDPVTGVVTGVGAGTVIISYTFSTGLGCAATFSITVNPLPGPIVGGPNLCLTVPATLTDPPGGGTWTSGNIAAATIDPSTGIVSPNALDTVTITYTLSTGCSISEVMTINPLPAAVLLNRTEICQGDTTLATDATATGTWSSSATGVATVDSVTGIVTGVGGGTADITFTDAVGCTASATLTVDALAVIGGALNVCTGFTTALTTTIPGGTWTSSGTAVATVDGTTGVVSGIIVGMDTITYTPPSGCVSSVVVTVNSLPSIITGDSVVCAGATITVLDSIAGGNWGSANTTIATVGNVTGIVTGGAVGTTSTVTITYTIGTGCFVTRDITVNPLPTAIGGPTVVCQGATITATDGTPGGVWSISDTTVATVDSTTGVVTGVSTGTATLTYGLNSTTGCYITELITVNTLPGTIVSSSGSFEICSGATITLSDPGAPTPGTWSSTTPAVASVIAGTGVTRGGVPPAVPGVATIKYTVTATGCFASVNVTVDAFPAALITPLSSTTICPGSFVELTATTGTGFTYQWTLGGVPIAGATNSTYTATAGGAYRVQVANAIGCSSLSAITNVTVATPSAFITGAGAGCAGTGVLLTEVTGGGLPGPITYQWIKDGVSITGAVLTNYTALASGDYTVLVTDGAGCTMLSNVITVTISPLPTGVVTVSGPVSFCTGGSVTLTADLGYTYQWFNAGGPIAGATDNTYIATVSGNYHVVETGPTGCVATSGVIVVTVNPIPTATVTIVGDTSFCAGGSVSFTLPAIPGGTYQWFMDGLPITGATTNSYVASVSGHYSGSITSSAGCSDTSTSITATLLSIPTIIPLTSTSFCWGGSSHLSVTLVAGIGPVGYQWYRDGVLIPGANSADYIATMPGNYTVAVTLLGPAGCISTSAASLVTEYPLPNPLINYTSPVLHTQTYYVTYQWYKDLIPISGATTYSTIATGNGNYKVAVTDSNGCQSVSDIYVLTGWGTTNGVGMVTLKPGDVRIYPNPAQNTVHIECAARVRAVVTSVDGKVLIDREDAKDIDLTGMANGIYMIMVYDDSGQMVKAEKLVKESN